MQTSTPPIGAVIPNVEGMRVGLLLQLLADHVLWERDRNGAVQSAQTLLIALGISTKSVGYFLQFFCNRCLCHPNATRI